MKRSTSFAMIAILGMVLMAASVEMPKYEKQMARTEISQFQSETVAAVEVSNDLLASKFSDEYVSEETQEVIAPYADVIVGKVSKGFTWLPVKPPVYS